MERKSIFLLTFFALALFISGCSKNECLEAEGSFTKSMSLGLEITKVNPLNSKAGALDGDGAEIIPYCEEEITLGGVAVAKYSISFLKSDGVATRTLNNNVLAWSVTDVTGASSINSRISDLQQIDFFSDEATAILTVEDFRVYDVGVTPSLFTIDNASDQIVYDPENVDSTEPILKFVTPKVGSAYQGYVDTPLSQEFVIDLYEKQYLKMDVLCFEKQDIPYFGYTWFDFEVVTGDEVCVFFNCLGNTPGTYHQVFAAEFNAKYYDTTSGEYIEYWAGQNFVEGVNGIDIGPFCIPCPGNWMTYGMEVEISPRANSDLDMIVKITPGQISAFLDDDSLPISADMTLAEDEEGYALELGTANDIHFLHYILESCDMVVADAFLSDFTGEEDDSESNIYAINYDLDASGAMSNFTARYLFSMERKRHLAMKPDGTTLIAVQETAAATDPTATKGVAFSIIDVTTFVETPLIPETPVGGIAESYCFKELVYVDDVLWALCEEEGPLVKVLVDWDNNTYRFVEYDRNPYLYSDGDLLAVKDHVVSFAGDGSLEYFTFDNGSLVANPGNDQYFWYLDSENTYNYGHCGASMVYNEIAQEYVGVLVSTSESNGSFGGSGINSIHYCHNNSTERIIPTTIEHPASMTHEFYGFGGDLASRYNSSELEWATFVSFFIEVY